MTHFIDIHDLTRLLAPEGLAWHLEQLGQYIRADFLRWEEFDKVSRLASHSQIGVIELMPAADKDLYAFKYVNGHPGNTAAGLQTVMAFGVLCSVATGYPLLLSELTLATALRTAATSALAAELMARPDSRTMAIIGNGAQSEFQAIALAQVFALRELRLYDVDANATAKLINNLSGHALLQDTTLTVCHSVAEAVRGADIVTTITADKRLATIVTPDMVEPGMHFNAVGGDCPGKTELHRDIVKRARVMVEYEPQTRIEGEIQQLPGDSQVVHLWQALAGRVDARTSRDEFTVFDSVGFALEDFSTLRYLYDLVRSRGQTRSIDLVPTLADPKDLFGFARKASKAGVSGGQRLAA
jgi:ornithine cyclodeaminase